MDQNWKPLLKARQNKEKAMRIEAYLFFGRQAEEAMTFYKGILGGELTLTRRGEVDPEAPEDMKNLVINAALDGANFHLRGSDNTDVTGGSQNRVALSLIGSDDTKMRAVFDGLAVGGEVHAPLEKMFWGDTFGALTDKYGIGWQVNIEAPNSLPA